MPRSPLYSIAKYSLRARILALCLLIFTLTVVAGCSLTTQTSKNIRIYISVDGVEKVYDASPGTTIQQAISQSGIPIGSLDRTMPAAYTLISNDLRIQIIRVTEKYEVSQVVIPFQQQVISNESLPIGERRLIQPGEAGLNEITTRIIFEDGILTSQHQVKTITVHEAVPEIVMVGVQEPFVSLGIPGRLVYLTAGNGWMMDGSTGSRKPVVSTGDLDGRIFNLSKDGNWLLFTRKSEVDPASEINSLWVARVGVGNEELIDLQVSNVIHFADFIPGIDQTIAYSTVEPRQAAPGWQANNDLYSLRFNSDGGLTESTTIIGEGSGGIYGWWGTDFKWSPNGRRILYSRPDGIGLVDPIAMSLNSLIDIIPFQTNSSWAWIPGVAWDQSGALLYLTTHPEKTGLTTSEDSPVFNLSAVNIETSITVTLAEQIGMFAYPVVSPVVDNIASKLAYLQAVFPERSDSSTYSLIVSDLDGSNSQVIFPNAGSSGLNPQQVFWSPGPVENGDLLISLVYQGNIWLIDTANGSSQQITGDGLTSRLDWQ